MKPAWSVLIFTLSSGAGYGMMILMAALQFLGIDFGFSPQLMLISSVLALVLITLGLLSSTLHLANPKNAWRAFSRFRTSWLSREGVFAVLFYPVCLLYLFGIWQQGLEASLLSQVLAFAVIALALLTLFSTGMIYASLKTIRQWHTSLTPLNYLVLGLMTGALLLLSAQSLVMHTSSTVLLELAWVFLTLGLLSKLIYLYWIGKPAGSSINTATGFTQARVRLLETGHSAGTFLTEEFGYHVEADKLLRLRGLMLFSAFALPMVLLTMNNPLIATLCCLCGIFVERWLFFAEARHVVRLYHGDQAT